MSSRRSRVALPAVGAAAIAAIACFDLTSSLDSAGLSIGRLPAPSVVIGDSIRDTLGNAVPLTAEVRGNRTLRFIALDSAIRVDTNHFLTARTRDTAANAPNLARVIADAGGSLQTPPQSVTITVRPDQIVANGGAIATLLYDPAAVGTVADTANRSAALQIRLRHFYTPGEAFAAPRDTVVRAFVVRFHIVSVPAIADSVRLVSDLGNPTIIDTTDAAGLAARRVRVFPRSTATADDSVVVLARVAYRGADIAGSPLRIVLPLRKR